MKVYYNFSNLGVNERPILLVGEKGNVNLSRCRIFKRKNVSVDLGRINRTSILPVKISVTSMVEDEKGFCVLDFDKLQTV